VSTPAAEAVLRQNTLVSRRSGTPHRSGAQLPAASGGSRAFHWEGCRSDSALDAGHGRSAGSIHVRRDSGNGI
jgi:hypothetical protein